MLKKFILPILSMILFVYASIELSKISIAVKKEVIKGIVSNSNQKVNFLENIY